MFKAEGRKQFKHYITRLEFFFKENEGFYSGNENR
jgi:hypothetical protein